MRDRGCIRNIRTWFVDMVLSNSFLVFFIAFLWPNVVFGNPVTII